MRRRAGSTIVATIVMLPIVLGASTASGSPMLPNGTALPAHVPGEAIVAFRDGTQGFAKNGALAEIDATAIRTLGSTGALLVRLNDSTVEEAIAQLSGHPEIAFIEPNFIYSKQAIPNDPQFDLLWTLRNEGQTSGTPGVDIHATEAWDVFRGNRETLVAVIDTGVDYTHPDLAANIWTNPGEVPGNGIDDDGNGYVDDIHGWDFVNDDNDPMDDHFHGTHVAGTIGAVGDNAVGIVGVNWEVSIVALKFLDEGGFGTTATAIAAVDYAIDNGARILNNSWGGSGFSQALRLAIERANRANALFVAAAGNNFAGGRSNDFFPFFPATYPTPNIVAVAATDHDDLLAGFSNFGLEAVDLAAPGAHVYSTFPNDDYGFLNGTSMATPHVAGALALLLGLYPEIAAVDAKALLLENVDPVPGLAGRILTGGRLNAWRLLSDPDSEAPAPATDLRAGNADANRVDLTWTATGDDGLDGTASRYDVRFASFPIDDGNFDAATRAVAPPRPGAAGAEELLRVDGLSADTTYWFALRVLDEYTNRSPLSNVVQQRTLGPPVIRATPDAITADLFTGESAERVLSLENLGIGELIYDVVVEGISPTPIDGTVETVEAGGAFDQISHISLQSDSGASPLGPPELPGMFAGSGNKEVTDATAANGSTYSYHEFDAPVGHFNGIHQRFDADQPVYVSFWVRPGSVRQNDGYFVIRGSARTDAIFFYASSSGYFHLNDDVGGNTEVPYADETWYHIEFRDIDYDETTFDYYVDGVLIQADVRFRFPGARDFDRLDLYSFDAGAQAWWDEIVLTELPPVLPIAIEPASGILPAAGRIDLAVRLDATGLNGGIYDAALVVASNDPTRPDLRVPVQLRVTGAPDITVSDAEIDFGALFLGGVVERTLTVSNRGTDLLEVRQLTTDHPEFVVDPSPFELAPGELHALTLSYLPTSEGVATARLAIESNDPDVPTVQVTLRGTGLLPPDIEVQPGSLSEALVTGGRVDVELQIRNTGFSELEWEIAFPGDPHPTLESVLRELDAGHAQITAAVPGLHPMTGGSFGTSIFDGGDNMFDLGNFLSTDRGAFLEYSDGEIVPHELLGENGRFFTRKYPGLFVLAADLDEGTFFHVAGNVGSGARPSVDESILEVRANGLRYRAFVMRSSGAERPSVNHLIIVEDRPGTRHRIQPFESQYSHLVYGLDGSTRLYYLLFGGREGRYYPDSTLGYVASVFFDVLDFGPTWLETDGRLGRIDPDATATLNVEFDAFGLDGGDYDAALRILTNIPGSDEVVVPVEMHVEAAADIALSGDPLDFGNVFVGQTTEAALVVSNHGTVELHVTEIVSDHPAFSAAEEELTILPGYSAVLTIRFAPDDSGPLLGRLTLASDDPDEAIVTATLTGTAMDPPVIEIAPMTIDIQVDSGSTATRSLVVRNLSGATLRFDVLIDFGATEAGAAGAPGRVGGETVDDAPAATGRQWAPVHIQLGSDEAAGAAKAGSVESPEVFFFADGFEDGLLDGWIGLGAPPPAEDSATFSRPRFAPTRTSIPVGPIGPVDPAGRNGSRHGASEIAVVVVDSTSPGTAKGASNRLRVVPTQGGIPAGQELTLEMTVFAGGLVSGDYVGTVRVRSNDPVRPEVVATVNLRVDGEPIIGVGPQELGFGQVSLGLAEQQSVTVTNHGYANLTIEGIEIDDPAFTANADGFELVPGHSRSVSVIFEPRAVGRVDATMTLRSNSAESESSVALSGTGIQGAELAVTPAVLQQAQFRGETIVRSLTLHNRGGEPLEYSVEVRPHGRPPTFVSLFEDDLESGVGGWTTQSYGGDDLWWWNDVRFFSGSHAWGCMTEDDTYATADAISSAAISPPIDLRRVADRVTLRFRETYTTEPGWDQCMVDISTDGGDTWTSLRGAYGSAPSGSSRGWVQENLPLTPFAGEIVNVRFYFETVDAQNNAFPGWSFDDVDVTADAAPWVTLDPAAGTLAPGETTSIEVTLTALDLRPAATYTADLEVITSAALTPLLTVPLRLDVGLPPRAALQGEPVVVESEQLFFTASARTDHRLELPVPPAGPGTLSLEIAGDFADADRLATLTAEALSLGALSGDAACATNLAVHPLSSDALADLAADGIVEAFVRNSATVDSSCADNRHVVRVEYVGELQGLDFGEVRVGALAALPLLITNTGGNDLIVSSIESAADGVVVDRTSAVVPPNATTALTVAWRPSGDAPLDAMLDLATNDPARRAVRVPLRGSALAVFPEAIVDTSPLVAALPPHADIARTRTIPLYNAGDADLVWNVLPIDFGVVEPAAGLLAPGESTSIAVRLTAAELGPGDYDTTVAIETNDPVRPRIDVPLTLHVRLVPLDVFEVDFSPKFPTRPGTVEVVLQLPAEFDARNVLSDTVTLQGVAADPSPLLRDVNRDGIDELILQFDAALLDAALPAGDSVLVDATGEVDNRAWFHGTAWVRGRIEVDPDHVP